VVYDAAQVAFLENRTFSAVLAADPRVSAYLSAPAIDKLLDPVTYTGLCAEMAKQAVARVRKITPVLVADG
jgi:3-carboxy-cis,cis-muconate cycloisomerase